MFSKKVLLTFMVLMLSGLILTNAHADYIPFVIKKGTALNNQDWNSPDEPLVAKVGDVLILVNADDQDHALHALGRPCDHGELIKPGQSWSCVLATPYDSRAEAEPLRDHYNAGQKFWLVVTPQ